jgi:acetyl-CoA carboxylase biotin carboxyl carrier protein
MADSPERCASGVPERDVEALIELFERSDWVELHLELGQLRLDLSKHKTINAPPLQRQTTAPPSTIRVAAKEAAPKAQAVAATGSVSSPRERPVPDGWFAVRAPNLGTFYRSPKPGDPPYVEVGQEIAAGSEICLLEVMKLFTAVVTRVGGVVREICVVDGEMIERDQLLMLIEPKS